MKFKHVAALVVALVLMVAVTAGFAGDEGATPTAEEITQEEMEIMQSHHPELPEEELEGMYDYCIEMTEEELEEMYEICHGEDGNSGIMGGHHNNMMGF